jgi:hypothetical protein
LDRYAYTFNNPVRYTDPSGHIPKEEICKYLGICGEDASKEFEKKYGKELHELLWDTKISWGDKLEWKKGGKLQVAMMVLYTTDGENFFGVLWMIEGQSVGYPISFSELSRADNIDGRSSVNYTTRRSDVTNIHDLPKGFVQPDGSFDGNTPYMYAREVWDWPEGTTAMTILIPVAGKLPATLSWVSKTMGATDAAATLLGYNPESPYWYNHAFGPIHRYPTMCYSSALSRSCNYGHSFTAP